MFRNIPEDSTIEIWVNTVDPATGAPVAPSSAFTTADFAIHKNGSATEKATANGITVTSPFDSETGLHLVAIDTGNDTGDAGFWATGARYAVRFNTAKTVGSVSIDGRVVPQGQFGIESEYMRGTNSANTTTPLDAAGMRTAVGLASANLDTQLAAVPAAVDAAIANQLDGTDLPQILADLIAQDWIAGDATPLAIVAAIKTDGTIAAALANIDAAISSRLASGDVTVGGYAAGQSPADALATISATALARFVTVDTSETTATAGSVAAIAQGAAGSGDVTSFSGDAADRLDTLEASVAAAAAAAAANAWTQGTVEGMPAYIYAGDSYPTLATITPLDANGDPVTTHNGKDFATDEDDHAFRLRRQPSQGAAAVEGSVAWNAGTGKFELTLAATDTRSAIPGDAWQWQLILWADTDDEYTLGDGEFEIRKRIEVVAS